MSQGRDWTFHGFAGEFDGHVREQLPWYELASAAMGLIARQYIPKEGKVYDLGASTGNVGRVLAPTLEARCARLTALDECPDISISSSSTDRRPLHSSRQSSASDSDVYSLRQTGQI